jgi:LPS O-antigen subunit length determinant protein (WzzB/FepE family)
MSLLSIIVMIFVVGTVWGGFIILLTIAAKKEKRKEEIG